MRFKLNPLANGGISVDDVTIVQGGGTSTTSSGSAVTSVNTRTGDVVITETDILPTQTGNSGKYLTTDGTNSSWAALAGGGDMSAATYDPTSVVGDAFSMDNMAETATKKILTSAERTILSNTSGTNTGDQDLSTYQLKPAEGAFIDGDKTKLNGIETGADVTDTTNVTAAGALMDSEVTNLAQVKAFSSADYATAAQGSLADSATQPGDNISTLTNDSGFTTNVGDVTLTGTQTLTNKTLTTPTITLAQGLTPAPTAEGDIQWDTDGNQIAIGDGTGTKVFSDDTVVLARANHTGTQTASTISDFDTEVSNNTDVAANTAARHAAVTVADSSEIDLTLTGQQISASIVAGSIDETKLDTSTNASLDLADSSVQPGDNISTLTNDSGFTTNTGTVTSVAATVPTGMTVSGSPITTSGTLGLGYDTGYQGYTTTEASKLSGIETGADVTDAANVNAAGAVMNSDYTPSHSILVQQSGTGSPAALQVSNNTLVGRLDGGGSDIDDLSATDVRTLLNVEDGADVTDTANVTAAGALMDSEVDADIKTLSLPASTTISAFGATLVDDADAATARTTIGLGNVDNTSDATKNSASATLTNKTIDGDDNTIQDVGQSSLKGGNYTTSEVSTGSTFLGSAIYKKTISFGALPNNTSKAVAHTITGLSNIINYTVMANDGTFYLPIPYSHPTVGITLFFDGTNITIQTTSNRTSYTTCYVTMWYTK